MNEWKPIETAPRDGTRILIWHWDFWDKANRMTIGYWIPKGKYRESNWTSGSCDGQGEFDELESPIYWRELPEPPQ